MIRREPPHDFEAEQAVLGALISWNATYFQVSDQVRPEYFSDPAHGRLYEVLSNLIERGQSATALTLKAQAEQDEALKAAGGAKYLAKLMASAALPEQITTYAGIVRRMYEKRQMLLALERAQAEVWLETTNPAERAAALEQELQAIVGLGVEGGYRPFAEVADKTVGLAEAAYHARGELIGLPTGLTELDQMLGGLHPGELIILAGRPSMGKTALATNIAFRTSRHVRSILQADGTRHRVEGETVGVVSLEMTDHDLMNRILADQAGVPSTRVRRGELNSAELDRYIGAADAKAKLFIDETPAQSIATVRARARRLKRQHGLTLLVVDYLQLLDGANKRDGRVQEVSEITRGLKALAKELGVPVLALSQLSRAVEARSDKRPQLADLRESGSIEQDADVVLFVYREEYYLERSDKRDGPEHDAARGKAEIIVAKQRHGPTGTAFVRFDGRFTRFSNAPSERYSAEEMPPTMAVG